MHFVFLIRLKKQNASRVFVVKFNYVDDYLRLSVRVKRKNLIFEKVFKW